MAGALQAALGSWLALAAPEVGDDGRPVGDALQLHSTQSCLDHDRLAGRIVMWLRRDRVDDRLHVEVHDDADGGGVRYVLKDEDEVIAQRPFPWTTDDCGDRHVVLSLSIAMAIDATVLKGHGVADPFDGPVPEPPPEEPPPEEPPPEELPPEEPDPPPPEAAPRTAVRLTSTGIFSIGAPQGIGGGGELGVELGWLDIIDVRTAFAVTTSGAQPFVGGSLTTVLFALRADVCAGPSFPKVRPRACGGALGGAALARGDGFVVDSRTTEGWMALALGGGMRAKLTKRVNLDLGLDWLATLVKPAFVVQLETSRAVRRFSQFGIAARIGVSVALR